MTQHGSLHLLAITNPVTATGNQYAMYLLFFEVDEEHIPNGKFVRRFVLSQVGHNGQSHVFHFQFRYIFKHILFYWL